MAGCFHLRPPDSPGTALEKTVSSQEGLETLHAHICSLPCSQSAVMMTQVYCEATLSLTDADTHWDTHFNLCTDLRQSNQYHPGHMCPDGNRHTWEKETAFSREVTNIEYRPLMEKTI